MISPEDLFRRPSGHEWTVAQILEHMVKANEAYLPMMREAVKAAEPIANDPQAHLTFWGAIIAHAAGPNSKAPLVPASLEPAAEPDAPAVLARWLEQQRDILDLVQLAKGKDIARARVSNPLIRALRMNLIDCFEVVTSHAERHLGQIETGGKGLS